MFSKKILTKRALRELKCVTVVSMETPALRQLSRQFHVASHRLLAHFRGHKNVRSKVWDQGYLASSWQRLVGKGSPFVPACPARSQITCLYDLWVGRGPSSDHGAAYLFLVC